MLHVCIAEFCTHVQACYELPESGVATPDTWRALVGPDMAIEDALALTTDSEYDDDMTDDHGGMVWLVGEQRWSKPYKPQQ